jgi:hypothetical protein
VLRTPRFKNLGHPETQLLVDSHLPIALKPIRQPVEDAWRDEPHAGGIERIAG